VQVFARTVVVTVVVLSRRVAVAQSYVTESVHTTRYQNASVPPLAGAVKVCATELSPLKGDALPTWAAAVPLWDVVEIAVLPV
jgi:hypothetical protein